MAKKQPIVVRPWFKTLSFHCLAMLLVAVLVTVVVYSRENGRLWDDRQARPKIEGGSLIIQEKNISGTNSRMPKPEGGSLIIQEKKTSGTNHMPKPESGSLTVEENKTSGTDHMHGHGGLLSRCDVFSGNWVYDSKSYPLYKDYQCSFMFDDLACEKYGRKDLNYQHWRWQPNDCNLPRFDAEALLERLRNKRLVFVGDSVNRNQWVSMVCLVESAIPEGLKSRDLKKSLYTFKATEYNATIDFYWAPMLVESNGDDPSKHHVSERVVRINAIEKHGRQWIDADIIVFNSYLWWKFPIIKVISEGSTNQSNRGRIAKLTMHPSYKMALRTWSNWLQSHVDPAKSRLFWVSLSSTHSKAEDWGMDPNKKCMNETEPIAKQGYWGSDSDPKMMRIAEGEISKLKSRGLEVQILNITQLSEYRKDGHPSIYRKHWVPLTQQQLANPTSYADCGHWCLPGVPDVWNELLYAYLLHY